MSVSASIQIPHLKKGQLLSEWSKDYLRATVMLNDTQRVQLLPSYVHRTRGEKSLAESVSDKTDFTAAINEIKKFIDPEQSHIQLNKQFYDVGRSDGDDCTSVFFELYNKGTDAKIPTDMIFTRFLTLFKGGDKFYEDNTTAIKSEMSKTDMTVLFGKFKKELDKKSSKDKVVIIKEEPEENYVVDQKEQQPEWAKDMQDQLHFMQGQLNECRSHQNDYALSSGTETTESEEVYQYQNSSKPKNTGKKHDNKSSKQSKNCKTCKRSGHSAEKCWKRICENCGGKGHSDFECSSYRKKENNQQRPQSNRQA